MRYQFIDNTLVLMDTEDRKVFMHTLKRALLEDVFDYIGQNIKSITLEELAYEKNILHDYLRSDGIETIFEKLKEYNCGYELRIE